MLQVELSRSEGRPGEVVRVRVRPEQAEAVSAVRLVVDEADAGVDGPLQREGDAWVLEASVPWEAPPGTYGLSFLAYGAGGALLESARATFTVL